MIPRSSPEVIAQFVNGLTILYSKRVLDHPLKKDMPSLNTPIDILNIYHPNE
jgi:hypothetical protein